MKAQFSKKADLMKYSHQILILTIFLVIFSAMARAADNVYVSKANSEKSKDVDAKIQEYVQQVIHQSFMRKIGEIVQDKIVRYKIGMPEAFAILAVNQAAVGAFEQPAIKETIQNTYRDTVKYALDEREKRTSDDIPQAIQFRVSEALAPIYEDEIFKKVIELAIEGSLKNYREIVIQQAVQQQVQKAIIQQKVLEQYIQQQLAYIYQQALQQALPYQQ